MPTDTRRTHGEKAKGEERLAMEETDERARRAKFVVLIGSGARTPSLFGNEPSSRISHEAGDPLLLFQLGEYLDVKENENVRALIEVRISPCMSSLALYREFVKFL